MKLEKKDMNQKPGFFKKAPNNPSAELTSDMKSTIIVLLGNSNPDEAAEEVRPSASVC